MVVVQGAGARTDDAAVDDEALQVEALGLRGWDTGLAAEAGVEVFQNFQLLTSKRELEAVGEADQRELVLARRRAGYYSHCAARVHEGTIRSPNLHQRHNLRAGGDVPRRLRRHGQSMLPAEGPGEFEYARSRLAN